jgi:hypothetical protein
MILRRRTFVAGALLGALVGSAESSKIYAAQDAWPAQPPMSDKRMDMFRGPFPPYGRGTVFERGGYWFLTPEALALFHKDRNSLPELVKEKKVLEISPARKIAFLETFVDFEGRAHVEEIGNGYVLLHDWF